MAEENLVIGRGGVSTTAAPDANGGCGSAIDARVQSVIDSGDPAALRIALAREAKERRRQECLANIQTEITRYTLELLVREADLDAFFRALLKTLAEEAESHVAGVWLLNEDNQCCEFWMAHFGGDPKLALPSLIFVTTWMWTGFNMVVLLAALHSLPMEVIEAAELDNCGWGAKLWHVIIPMVLPTLLNLLVLSFIGKMKIFDLVWITTKGGPLWATETVSTYTYKRAFEWTTFDLGYPSTIAAVWFVIVLAAVLGLTWAFRQRDRLEY